MCLLPRQPEQVSNSPKTEREIENEAFQQDKHEAFGLDLQAKQNTITPEGQERLTVLQAKISGLLHRRLEHASRFGHKLAKIAINRPDGNIRERSVKVREGLPPDSPLRQQATALSGEAKAINQEYRQLITLPQAEQAAGEASIRQRLEKLERAMADLESQGASAAAQKFPTEVTYGKNYLPKFRKHAEQIRRTTGRKEIAKVSTAEGQAQVKEVIEDIVKTGETRQRRYMSIADALWSCKGNAIVIRQADSEFVTFLEAGKGAALGWGD